MQHNVQQHQQFEVPSFPAAGCAGFDPALSPNTLFTTDEAAAYIGISGRTLATWRSTGRHSLRYIKVGSRVRYRLRDLDEWLASRSQEHTGQAMGE